MKQYTAVIKYTADCLTIKSMAKFFKKTMQVREPFRKNS